MAKTINVTLEFFFANPMFGEFQPFRDLINSNLSLLSDNGSEATFLSTDVEATYDLVMHYSLSGSGEIKITSMDIGDAGIIAQMSFSKPYKTGLTSFGTDGNGALSDLGEGTAWKVKGSGDADVFFGGPFKTKFNGKAGTDQFEGSDGNESAKGSGGDDFLNGGQGKNTLMGGTDHDMIVSQSYDGKDVAKGQAGNDFLLFGGTNATGIGGSGQDVFVFGDSMSEDRAVTTIKDFKKNEDSLVFADTPLAMMTLLSNDDTTLADLEQGDLVGLSWERKKGNLVLNTEGHKVILKGAKAKDVKLDHLGFTAADVAFTAKVMSGHLDTYDVATLVGGSGMRVGVGGGLNGSNVFVHDGTDVATVDSFTMETALVFDTLDMGMVP